MSSIFSAQYLRVSRTLHKTCYILRSGMQRPLKQRPRYCIVAFGIYIMLKHDVAAYQIDTRSDGARYILSPSLTPNDL
jgi:hypothetical protein